MAETPLKEDSSIWKQVMRLKKLVFISAPYFPRLSESFKQLFKYTPVQVSFKGQNTIKLMLMHPKDQVDPSLKKDIVYQWSCTKPNCKSSYIGETSRSLCEWVKEHSKEGPNSAINIVPPKAIHPPTLINSKL